MPCCQAAPQRFGEGKGKLEPVSNMAADKRYADGATYRDRLGAAPSVLYGVHPRRPVPFCKQGMQGVTCAQGSTFLSRPELAVEIDSPLWQESRILALTKQVAQCLDDRSSRFAIDGVCALWPAILIWHFLASGTTILRLRHPKRRI